jgi:FkbM family methyltransferase
MSDQGLTRDHIIWAYRILLDRDPENEAVILPKMKGYRTTRELRSDMVTSDEFRDKNRDFAQTNERNVVIKELESGVRLFVDLADHAIGLNIIRGRFEAAELAFVRRHLRDGDVAIDAGAHIGFFAMHMAQAVGATGHVYAFEPFAPNADLLARATAENGFGGRVTLERAAVGAEDGTAELVFARHTLNSGGAFLKGRAGAPAGHETERVRVVSLDRYPLRRPVRFLKMDVEGAEPLLVEGASRLLREDRPIVMTEIHREQLARVSGLSAEQFVDRMRALGYGCQAIQGDGTGAALPRLPDVPLLQVALVPDDQKR